MAITKKGKVPQSKKPAASSSAKDDEVVSSALSVMSATAKLTVSLKRRLGNGDEIFIAPGVEVHCAEDDLDTKQAEVTDRVTAWLEELTAKFPDPTDEDESEESEESEDEDEDEEGDDDGDGDEDEEDSLTEDDVNAMSLTELKKLVKEQELEDLDLKGMKVKEAREAVIEALFAEEGDEDADGDEDEDEDEEGDGDEEGDTYDEAELKAMKLEDLQEICKDWGIGDPKNIKKAKDLKSKKAAYIKHILEAQDEEDEE